MFRFHSTTYPAAAVSAGRRDFVSDLEKDATAETVSAPADQAAVRVKDSGNQFVHRMSPSEADAAFRSRRLLQRGGVDRQLPQTLPGCRKDRAGDCRHNR